MGRNLVQRALRKRRKRRTANRQWFTIDSNANAHRWYLELPIGANTRALLPSLERVHAEHASRYDQALHFRFGKWKADRVRLIAQSEQGNVYLRIYHLGRWWPACAMLVPRAQRGPFEAQCAARLQAAGIAHPAIVGAGPLHRGRWVSGSYAIQHHLHGFVLLMDYLRGKTDPSPEPADVQPICEKLGPFIAQLFEHGLLHGQLDPGHILVAPDAAGMPQLGLNDLEHMRLYEGPVPMHQRLVAIKRLIERLTELRMVGPEHVQGFLDAYIAHDESMQAAGRRWRELLERVGRPRRWANNVLLMPAWMHGPVDQANAMSCACAPVMGIA